LVATIFDTGRRLFEAARLIVINKAFEDTSPQAFKRVIDVNLNGSFNFASAVLPNMKPESQIALITSVAGLISNYGYSAYAASMKQLIRYAVNKIDGQKKV
jgi:NAD(P)-dependent dehydrogenase (short-subunit alcohol dehydrogenase family)